MCQKQPSTKIASRTLVNAMSGRPGSIRWLTRNRRPRRCSSLRRRISGPVRALGILLICADTMAFNGKGRSRTVDGSSPRAGAAGTSAGRRSTAPLESDVAGRRPDTAPFCDARDRASIWAPVAGQVPSNPGVFAEHVSLLGDVLGPRGLYRLTSSHATDTDVRPVDGP